MTSFLAVCLIGTALLLVYICVIADIEARELSKQADKALDLGERLSEELSFLKELNKELRRQNSELKKIVDSYIGSGDA